MSGEFREYASAVDTNHRARMDALWQALLADRAVVADLARQACETRVPRGCKPAMLEHRQVAHRTMAVATDAVYGSAMDSVIVPGMAIPERWAMLIPLLNVLMAALKNGPLEFQPPCWLMSLAASASLLELKARFPDAFQ